MLTVQQLQPTITDVSVHIQNNEYVAYQKGSFVLGLLKEMNFDESRLLTYNSPEEMNQFSKGGISAAFDETPYTKLFLAKYCSNYTTVDLTYKADGFGFVFPIASPLVPDVSRAILNVTEGRKLVDIEKKWFRDNAKCRDSSKLLSSKANRLGLESFLGLFLMIGIPAILVFINHVITFLKKNWDIIEQADQNSSIWDIIGKLLQRFNDRDPNALDFFNDDDLRRGNGRDGAGMEREMKIMKPPLKSIQQIRPPPNQASGLNQNR
ncbi:hypothetical protein BUALT_Bualt15G0118800 [Buddleja alternifolia]|uniref:Ionotropic glutamate receptor C-terminal domain-containing protein n=1 Tax=Buddleja alternifolia TaxID=168488 RepID=A0AAV6WF29_9LAMI|nr:hypothetical protein BUALT_Bualt15G0118800 [Buddleja alternifolia]